jgi:hypothetical protein
MYSIGDKIKITSTWDWMEYPLEEAYDNADVLTILDIDADDESVLIEVDCYDDDGDGYTDTYWVNFHHITMYKPKFDFNLTAHDLKYANVIRKIKRMEQIRKGKGYAF